MLHEQRPLQGHDLGLVGGAPHQHLLALGARRRGDVLRDGPGRTPAPGDPGTAPGGLGAAPLPTLVLLRLGHHLGDPPDLDGATAEALCLALLDCGVSGSAPDHLGALATKQSHGEIPSAPAKAGDCRTAMTSRAAGRHLPIWSDAMGAPRPCSRYG